MPDAALCNSYFLLPHPITAHHFLSSPCKASTMPRSTWAGQVRRLSLSPRKHLSCPSRYGTPLLHKTGWRRYKMVRPQKTPVDRDASQVSAFIIEQRKYVHIFRRTKWIIVYRSTLCRTLKPLKPEYHKCFKSHPARYDQTVFFHRFTRRCIAMAHWERPLGVSIV